MAGKNLKDNKEEKMKPKLQTIRDVIIHTPTQEEYNQVVQRCFDLGDKWSNGSVYENEMYWENYESQTCIFKSNTSISYTPKKYIEKECPQIPIITTQQFLSTYQVSPKVSEETRVTSEPKKETKIMSIIKNIFKSTEQKALSHYGITNGDGGLTETGRAEWIDYLWETLEEKAGFILNIVEEYKKEKKEK